MTENQKTKMTLLLMSKGNVENAKEAYNFIMADSEEPGKKSNNELADGIYLIKEIGEPVLFAPGCNKDNCIAVGIKLGSKSIAVALNDAQDGADIILTNSDDTTTYNNYKNTCLDAVADWNGLGNTEHLKEISLNEDIVLEKTQYIPSMGEILFIFLHKKELNEALQAVGGQPIANVWYWTSTEYSATYAWYLNLTDGNMDYGTKATNTLRVRPVSAFIS